MKDGRYVYRLDCGDLFAGEKDLPEGTSADCPLHGSSLIAGFGISMFRFLNPDYAPEMIPA